jgi:hypothetical protein
MLGSSVNISAKPLMHVGQQAVDNYYNETGAKFLAGQAEVTSDSLNLTPPHLALASEGRELLGDNYAILIKADKRGQSSPTPPHSRHRLIELIDWAERSAVQLEQQGQVEKVSLDGNLLAELSTTISLLQRWRNHPAWSNLAATLASSTEGQHTVMLLGLASYLADNGNGVGIVIGSARGRIPDIWIEPTLLERLEVEVKTPQALRGPRAQPLTIDEAIKIVESQLDKAASTKRGQLNTDHSGIVAIGGYHLGTGSLETLEKACKKVLARQSHRKKHVAALAVSEISYNSTNVIDRMGKQVFGQFTPTLQVRVARHPGYAGSLHIETEG